jgi:hypothetical protein
MRFLMRFSRKESRKTKREQNQKHTTGGIPRWSPTLVLVARFSAYVWQSGRDAQFSLTYGRMYQPWAQIKYINCKIIERLIRISQVVVANMLCGEAGRCH